MLNIQWVCLVTRAAFTHRCKSSSKWSQTCKTSETIAMQSKKIQNLLTAYKCMHEICRSKQQFMSASQAEECKLSACLSHNWIQNVDRPTLGRSICVYVYGCSGFIWIIASLPYTDIIPMPVWAEHLSSRILECLEVNLKQNRNLLVRFRNDHGWISDFLSIHLYTVAMERSRTSNSKQQQIWNNNQSYLEAVRG